MFTSASSPTAVELSGKSLFRALKMGAGSNQLVQVRLALPATAASKYMNIFGLLTSIFLCLP